MHFCSTDVDLQNLELIKMEEDSDDGNEKDNFEFEDVETFPISKQDPLIQYQNDESQRKFGNDNPSSSS